MAALVGGRPTVSACVLQNGQSSECWSCFPGENGLPLSPSVTLTCLTPVDVQISVHSLANAFSAASACEIDGPRATSKMAKHAIHAVTTLAIRFIRMPVFYLTPPSPRACLDHWDGSRNRNNRDCNHLYRLECLE